MAVEVYVHAFITLALDGVVIFTSRALYPRGKYHRYVQDKRLLYAPQPV
jgi:hypothetical protein